MGRRPGGIWRGPWSRRLGGGVWLLADRPICATPAIRKPRCADHSACVTRLGRFCLVGRPAFHSSRGGARGARSAGVRGVEEGDERCRRQPAVLRQHAHALSGEGGDCRSGTITPYLCQGLAAGPSSVRCRMGGKACDVPGLDGSPSGSPSTAWPDPGSSSRTDRSAVRRAAAGCSVGAPVPRSSAWRRPGPPASPGRRAGTAPPPLAPPSREAVMPARSMAVGRLASKGPGFACCTATSPGRGAPPVTALAKGCAAAGSRWVCMHRSAL